MRKIDLKNFQVATSETARDINRRIVLNFLRSHQPISRADLARHSGLQFSTVSLIIEELIEEQWVTEGALTDAPRGRKPRVLHFNSDRKRILGIDVRPTFTTMAIADMNGRFVAQDRIKTNGTPESFLAKLIDVVNRFTREQSVELAGIGVSLPGRVDMQNENLVFAPNLGWRNVDFKTPLEAATGLPVHLENAPNACALAEIWFGRYADGVQNLVAVTVSEGVGAGIFMNGQLLQGPEGLAGEFGHVSINESGPTCKCGNVACWEVYASNNAAVRYYNEFKGSNGNSSVPVTTFEQVLRLADEEHSAAIKALHQMGHYLGVGVAMIVASLAPSVIVLVGEVTHAWPTVGPEIEKVVKKKIRSHLATRVVPTDDQVHPRLRGAVAVVLHHQLGAPLFA